jgi:hypothetical protein
VVRRFVLCAAAAALALAGAPPAGAQLIHFGRPAAQQQHQQQPTDMAASCAQLKAMPNAPMTYDQCMQMAASQQAMQAAQNDPAGIRPGDEAMTCDQIKAEFAANGGFKVDKAQVAQAQTAGQNFTAANNQVQADARAMQAREAPMNAAAAATGMTPVGGAAAAAAQAQSVADQQALNAEARQKLDPAERQLMSADTSVVGSVATQMQANPRQARLVGLAEQKNCR